MPFGLTAEQLSAAVLLGLAVLMIMTGLLVPSRFYKEKTAEADRWKNAFEIEREARKISDQQTSELLEGQKASHAMIVAIFKNSEIIREAGGRDVAS